MTEYVKNKAEIYKETRDKLFFKDPSKVEANSLGNRLISDEESWFRANKS